VTDTAIPPLHRTVSASKLTETIADSLTSIKDEDELTDKEIGHFLGKGVDAGKAYRTGYAEMGFVSFLRGCATWNGRFANDALALIGMKLVPLAARPQSDRKFGVILSRLKLAVDEALENDDEIDDRELDAMRALLDEAGQAIDARRAQPLLKAVSK
jgi:hypothetical protein